MPPSHLTALAVRRYSPLLLRNSVGCSHICSLYISSSMFSSLSFLRSQPSKFELLPLDVPIDEERFPNHESRHFYHANPGEVLGGRLELKVKIGYGRSSTVWLAQPAGWRFPGFGPKPYVTVKICENRSDNDAAQHELEIGKHIATTIADHNGFSHLRPVRDSFEIEGPHGKHICLLFEPLREPIWVLQRRLGSDRAEVDTIDYFKHFIGQMLEGLSLLHTKCEVIHTDLKLENILMTVEDVSVLDEFVRLQKESPMARKVYDDRTVYRSNDLFGDFQWDKSRRLVPVITDFGLAHVADTEERIIPIQPRPYTAPEVLLGAGWSYSADIWNFGQMAWTLLAGKDLFTNLFDDQGHYSARYHLAQMVALLGPAPKDLLERAERKRLWRWSTPIPNDNGVLCDNIAAFYGGPFFDKQGGLVGEERIPKCTDLRETIPECIVPGQVDLFLDFMRKMLCWLPENRATADELRKHAWLDKTNGQ